MITVPNKLIQAAQLFVSKDGSRYVLNYFNIENNGPLGGTIVATDGRKLFAAQSEQITFTDKEKDMPMAMFRAVPKGKYDHAMFENLGDSRWIVNGTVVSKYTGDAKYPNWRQVITEKSEAKVSELPAFNASFMAAFATTASLLARKNNVGCVRVFSNGSSESMLIKPTDQCEDWDWIGVLMPTHADNATPTIPSWAKQSEIATGGAK